MVDVSTIRPSIISWFKALSWGGLALLIAVAIWFGSDIVTYLFDQPDSVNAAYNLQPARALKDAQLKAIKGPETVYVYQTSPAVDQEIRARHRPTVAAGGPIQPATPTPVAGQPQNTPQDAPGSPQNDKVYPALLDFKDLYIACSGVTYEVGCWLGADGHGEITVEERPKTAGEKAKDVLKKVSNVWGWENAIEVGVLFGISDPANNWEAWGAYEPVRIARSYPRIQVEHSVKEGEPDTEIKIGVRTRFSLRKKK